MTEVIDSLDFANANLFQKHGFFFPPHFASLAQTRSLIAGFCCHIFPEREKMQDKKASLKLRLVCERKEYLRVVLQMESFLSAHTA